LRGCLPSCWCLSADTLLLHQYPTLINEYKQALAVAVETDYIFPLAEKVKAFLADPSAFAVAAPAAVSPQAAATPAVIAPAKVEEELEESDEDKEFGLFD
uniref:Large ribosomal subunit protein uL10 n=1 Tax=Monodelphis domestica TaxID=13616 RepID=A0A5F8GC33_MONDO